MRFFLITKKQILVNLFTILIFIIIFFIFFTFKDSNSFAIEFSKNSIASSELMEQIANVNKNDEKVAFLTFDDGPTLSTTPKVLDILKEENVKASFFVIGKYVDKHPEIVKREFDEGHYIANHGYDHNNSILYKSRDSFANEIKKTDISIGKAIGIDNYCSSIFRFPNGFMSPNNKVQKKDALKILSELNYVYIDWNCLNNDSVKKYSKEQLLNNLKKSYKDKDILVVLMHDTKYVNDSSLVLKESISYLRSEGYQFKNFYDLFQNIV